MQPYDFLRVHKVKFEFRFILFNVKPVEVMIFRISARSLLATPRSPSQVLEGF